MKAYLVTMGCPKNLVDSEATISLLRRSGCELTTEPENADVLMVSACSFLESAWRETIDEVERLARFKNGGDKRLILLGCLPAHRRIDLEERLPSVDHFLPAGAHGELPRLVESWRHDERRPRSVAPGGLDPFAGYEDRERLTAAHTAYVKVAEGCSRRCAFCAIPAIRGRQRSRPLDSILREVEGLVSRNVQEVNLLSQDIVAYNDGGTKFCDLVSAVAGTGVDWVRVFYVHPAGVDVESLGRVFEHPSVVRYLEMPIQHASNEILARMNRSYDRAHLEQLIRGIRRDLPDLVLRSEVIVGFPGEDADDFDELKAFVEEFEFDSLGIFPYSREPGTVGSSLDGVVDAATIRARVEELSAAQEAVSFGARAKLLGTKQRILIDRELTDDEGVGDACRFAGRFYGQAPEVDGEVFIESPEGRTAVGLSVGEFTDVKIVDAGPYDLKGRPVQT